MGNISEFFELWYHAVDPQFFLLLTSHAYCSLFFGVCGILEKRTWGCLAAAASQGSQDVTNITTPISIQNTRR